VHYTQIVILVIAASLAIGAAHATENYYVVKPSAMNGWVLTTIASANPIPGFKGISTGFVDPAPRACPSTPGSTDILPGAFYAALGTFGSTSAAPPADYTCGQIWLGTNAYNGVALDNITDLLYYEWTTSSGIYASGKKQWAEPRQPYGLCLVIKEADPSTVTHKLMYRPRNVASGGQNGFGWPSYADATDYSNVWKRHDPLVDADLWMEFTYGAPTSTCLWTGNWTAVKTKYPGATITIPALQVPGANGGEWPETQPVDTPNGCGVSIQWGAEAQAQQGGGPSWPYQPYLNWWRETWGGCGYVDNFEIGVGDTYDQYDFEADAPGHLVACATSWTQDSTAGKAPYYSHLNMEFKAFGKVISKPLSYWYNVTQTVGSPNGNEFFLDDGGIGLRVFCPGNTVSVGQWYAVTGKLMPAYGVHVQGDPREMRLHARTSELTLLGPPW